MRFRGTDVMTQNQGTLSPIVPPFSMSIWAGSSIATTEQYVFGMFGSGSGNRLHGLVFKGDDSGDPVQCVSRAGASVVRSNSILGYKLNKIHHILGVWTAVNNRLVYLDGVPGTVNTSSINVSSQDMLSVGTDNETGPIFYFTGDAYEAAFWPLALNTRHAKMLASGADPRDIPGLKHFYKLDQPGPRYLDFGFGRLDMTLEFGETQPISSGIPPPQILARERVLPLFAKAAAAAAGGFLPRHPIEPFRPHLTR